MENIIPYEIQTTLIGLIDKKLQKYDTNAQYFIIQYTYFEYINDCWIMKTLLDIGDETIDIVSLELSYGYTNIKIIPENKKYGILIIDKKLNTKRKSLFNIIYAPDLYINFEPQHFKGKCYTKKIEK